ncbi:unnamed protein product [Urochloa humidicola]
MAGRFICSAAYPAVADIVDHFATKYPHLDILKETELGLPSVQAHSDKLGELGFRYKYGMEEILDASIDYAVRLGLLDASKPRSKNDNKSSSDIWQCSRHVIHLNKYSQHQTPRIWGNWTPRT